ncbi:hypothetical protein CDD83_6998 [Cordyceps sp. RAO-2017]|nr:hypothetical protein CDD83_6998 [Cordyceps sp. RAO-2017]
MSADAVSSLVARATCPVQGNGDLYGLGIRIGLYLQMLTVQLSGMLSVYFRVEDHIGQGTIVFVLSTLIVLVRLVDASIRGVNGSSDTDPAIEPVEVFPVLTLLLIQVGVCRVSSRNSMTMLIWMAELVGLTIMYNYFWWRGMDLMPRSCPDDKAFFFAQVSIWGWFRSLNKAGAVVTAIATSMTVIAYCGSVLYYVAIVIVRFLQRRSNDHAAPGDGGDGNDQRSLTLGSVDLLANVGAIVYVELALKWNGITGVHTLDSPGQFMPFFIALAQFLSVFYSALKYVLLQYADEHALDDEDDSTLECHHENKGRYIRGDTEDIPL